MIGLEQATGTQTEFLHYKEIPMEKNIKVYSGLGLLILVVLFTLQNTETVPISFLFWEFRISRVLMILMIFVIGVLVGLVSSNYLKRN